MIPKCDRLSPPNSPGGLNNLKRTWAEDDQNPTKFSEYNQEKCILYYPYILYSYYHSLSLINTVGWKSTKNIMTLWWVKQATFTIVWRRSLRSGRDFFWRFLTHCDDTTFRANVFLLTMWYLLLTNPLGILPPKYRMKFYWTRNIRSKKGFQLLLDYNSTVQCGKKERKSH